MFIYKLLCQCNIHSFAFCICTRVNHVDREHVDRKQPDRLLQVLFVDVLDHRDLELARQEHDGEHRQDRQPHPARVAAGDALERGEQRRELRCRRGAREDVAEAVVDPEGHEGADREKREQLHERLERDGGHHALVVLGGVEVTRAERDREQRQDQRDPERGVLKDRHRADLGRHDDHRVLDEDREARRDRLQLQRDVGNDSDHRDDGHDAAEQRALPVAGRDEVGERGDAVLLRDAQDLAHDDPPERDHQRRPDVDRQESDAVARGSPHAAVERPRRRVDRERKAVDVRVRDDRAAGVGALVGVVGDREQQSEVRERGDGDDPALEHGALRSARLVAPLDRERHQRDEQRPGEEDVGVQHRDSQQRAGHVEQREDRVVEEQAAQHAQRDQARRPSFRFAHRRLLSRGPLRQRRRSASSKGTGRARGAVNRFARRGQWLC